jgi:hypothetical protein
MLVYTRDDIDGGGISLCAAILLAIVANGWLYSPLYRVATPYSGVPVVTLHRHVWEQHILVNHPDLNGREEWVVSTLQKPTAVCGGTTNPFHIGFVNQAITSRRSRSPFTIFVHPLKRMVVSAAYRNDFRDLTSHTLLWVPARDDA